MKPDPRTVPIRRTDHGSYAIDDALFLSDKDVKLLINALYLSQLYSMRYPETETSRAAMSVHQTLMFHKERRALADRDALAAQVTLPPL